MGIPADKVEDPRKTGWYVARNRVHARMEALAERPIAKLTPHDSRRTALSNTKQLKVDFDTAEAVMNHQKAGLERIYDIYDLRRFSAASVGGTGGAADDPWPGSGGQKFS